MEPSQGNIVSAYASLGRLLWSLSPRRLELAAALALLLLASALEASSVGMLVPLLSSLSGDPGTDAISQQVQRLVPDLGQGQAVLLLAALTFGLIACKNAVFYCFVLLGTRLRRDATVRLRGKLLDGVLHASADVLEKRSSGELMNVFLTEAARTSLGLDYMIQLTQRGILALSYLVAILFISWHLTLLVLVVGACLASAGLLLSRRLLRQGERLATANSSLARRLSEISGGLRLIRTTHSEARETRHFAEANRTQAGAEASMTRTSVLVTIGIETLAVATSMGLTAIAYRWLLSAQELSMQEFLAFGFGLVRLIPAANQVYGLQLIVTGLTGSVRPTLAWLDLPRHPPVPFGNQPLGQVRNGIEFDRVSYAYPDGSEALRELSFKVPAGSFLAVVGSSGAGKTTLASLLLRLRKPSSGTIRIDGQDYWRYEPESYAAAIAYVEQDPFLFNATIADNLRYGAPDVTGDDLTRVLAQVGLDTLIDRLPAGLDTVLGERGGTLSGGERQRLAIARALLRSPQLMILDEPTSALDGDAEREVVAAIEQARVGRTLIVIAHRLSTIERADAILDLNNRSLTTVTDGLPRALGA